MLPKLFNCAFSRVFLLPALVIVLSLVLLSGACSSKSAEGFAIYLTAGDSPPAQMPDLSQVEIAKQPVIALDDIISYDPHTHEISLASEAFKRLSDLSVPVNGRSFVVCVDRKPLYWGAFWTPISSLSFEGVTIWKPLVKAPEVIKIEAGYPSSSFFTGEDPRTNPEIQKSLRQFGKLNSSPPPVSIQTLPRSMKGYELYSWSEDGQWHFTLMTGTNRNKSAEEIISIVNYGSEGGWVHLHVVGVETIITVLKTLPQGESVFWIGGAGTAPNASGGVEFALPPVSIIDAVKESARQAGLELRVSG